MQEEQLKFNFKLIKQIGWILFLIQFLLSIWLFVERISFADVSFQLFELLRTGEFPTQVFRFGSKLTHLFPWLGYKLGLSLKWVALFYSVGVVMYNFLIFLFLAYIRKSYRWTLVFVLYLPMLLGHMFFWIQSEYSQAIPFLIMTLAVIDGLKNEVASIPIWIITIGLVVTAVFFHPLIFVLLTLAIVILLTSSKHTKKAKVNFLLFWIIALITFLIKRVYFNNYYDDGAQDRIKNFISIFPNYFTTKSTLLFLNHALGLYLGLSISILWFVVKGFLIKKKLLLFLGSCLLLGYFLIVNVSHPNVSSTDLFYLENMYLGLGFVLALIFCFWYSKPYYFKNKYNDVTILASMLVLIFIFRIGIVSKEYSNRVAWWRNQLKIYEGKKILKAENNEMKKVLKTTWASAYESWFISTLDKNVSASYLITNELETFKSQVNNSILFVSIKSYTYDSLNPTYFKFKDTLQSYIVVP